MSRHGARSLRRVSVVAIAVAALLAVVRPWTIAPVESARVREFDAAAYVDGVWDSRVLVEADRMAAAIRAAIESEAAAGPAPQPRHSLFVKGTATVSAVDDRSRVGVLVLTVPGVPGSLRVVMQIGPVLRGTALRDALSFVRFTDFENQLQFAEVSSALNARVLRSVLARVDPKGLVGRTISFLGAVTVGGTTGDRAWEIMPVLLEVEGGPRGGRG